MVERTDIIHSDADALVTLVNSKQNVELLPVLFVHHWSNETESIFIE